MKAIRYTKKVGLGTFLAVTTLSSLASAGTINVLTSSGSQDSVGHNSFVTENIDNGIPEPGNGPTLNGGTASGSVGGNQFTDTASATSSLAGVTTGAATGKASLVDGTVHAYAATANANLAGYDYNDSGYQSSAKAHSDWVESLIFGALPGQPLGSLVPVTLNIHADAAFFNDPALSGFTSFDYEVDLPDIRNNSGIPQGSEVRWQFSEGSDGFGDTTLSRRFCVLDGNCYGASALSGVDGISNFAYADNLFDGTMSVIVQGYAVSGTPFEVGLGLTAYANGDNTYMNFANTGWVTIDSPVTFTSSSGVFLSQAYSPSAAAPEPATVLYLLSGVAVIMWLRRGRRTTTRQSCR
jgi:hypothetical protein